MAFNVMTNMNLNASVSHVAVILSVNSSGFVVFRHHFTLSSSSIPSLNFFHCCSLISGTVIVISMSSFRATHQL